MGSQRLKQQLWGLHVFALGYIYVYIMAVSLVLHETPNSGSGYASTHLPTLGILFLLLGCLLHPQYKGFLPCLAFCFVLIGCCLLEASFFVKGNGWGMELRERGGGRDWEEWRNGNMWSGCIVWQKNIFKNKKRDENGAVSIPEIVIW